MSEPRYAVIQSKDIAALAEEVNTRLGMGWLVCGGIAVTTHFDKDTVYAQAMVTKGATP